MPYFMGKAAGWAVIAVLVASMTAKSGAQAAVVTAVAAAPPTGDFAETGVDVRVRQFDPTLGSLTGVSVSLTGQFLPIYTLVQAPASLVLPPVQSNPTVTLLNVSSPQVVGRTPILSIGIIQSLGAESVPFVASEGRQIASGAAENVNIATDLSLTASQVQFAGSGQLNFYINGRANVPNSASYNSYGQIENSVFNAQVAVTYTYIPASTAVPEPASLALLGATVIGLSIIRLGRRSGSLG